VREKIMFKEIQRIILERCYQIVSRKTMLKDLDMDSLDKMELLMDLEDVLDINIPENVLREELTLQEIINLRETSNNSVPQKARLK
jgi:acyl carrier protein